MEYITCGTIKIHFHILKKYYDMLFFFSSSSNYNFYLTCFVSNIFKINLIDVQDEFLFFLILINLD